MNPNQPQLDLQIYDVTVIYSVGSGYEECCHMVAAIEKEEVVTALQWYYKDAKSLVIVFT